MVFCFQGVEKECIWNELVKEFCKHSRDIDRVFSNKALEANLDMLFYAQGQLFNRKYEKTCDKKMTGVNVDCGKLS